MKHETLDPVAADAANRGRELAALSQQDVQAFYDAWGSPTHYAKRRWPSSKRTQRYFIVAFVEELERRGYEILATPAQQAKMAEPWAVEPSTRMSEPTNPKAVGPATGKRTKHAKGAT